VKKGSVNRKTCLAQLENLQEVFDQPIGHERPAQRRDLGDVGEQAENVAQYIAGARKVQRQRPADGVKSICTHDLATGDSGESAVENVV
jgi:hypothetical protein